MNCQQCGNEVQPEELFCGQCGTAILSSPLPTSRINSVSLGSKDLPLSHKNAPSPPLHIRASHSQALSTQTPPHPQTKNFISPSGGLSTTRHFSQETPESQQETVSVQQHQTEFYQDATQAMSLPSNQAIVGQARNLSHQTFMDAQAQKGLPALGQQRLPVRPPTQSLHADQYMLPRTSYPGQVASGQEYDYQRPIRPSIPSQSHKQQPGLTILIVSISFVFLLISVIGVTVLFLRGSSQNVVTSEPLSPTVVLQPTPTQTETPTPQTTPTLTPVSTPLPDPGFMWCGPTCTNYGFSVEYPVGWQLGGAPTNNGIQFTNPAQPNQIATFKAIGPTSGSAGDILNSELQTNFVTKPGYIPPQGTGVTTLGGETWAATTVYYQSANGYGPPNASQQRLHVAIYTIVYQSKGYAIEIQAPDPDGQQFTQIYNMYYAMMLSKFSFVQ